MTIEQDAQLFFGDTKPKLVFANSLGTDFRIWRDVIAAPAWLGWHVAVGYVLGFFVMLWVMGYHAHPLRAPHHAHRGDPRRGA